jgi:hypothetical protein
MALPAQVVLDGEWLDSHGVVGAPVILAQDAWEHVYPLELDPGEIAALTTGVDAFAAANSAVAWHVLSMLPLRNWRKGRDCLRRLSEICASGTTPTSARLDYPEPRSN